MNDMIVSTRCRNIKECMSLSKEWRINEWTRILYDFWQRNNDISMSGHLLKCHDHANHAHEYRDREKYHEERLGCELGVHSRDLGLP